MGEERGHPLDASLLEEEINRYRRGARMASETGLGVLAPMHQAVPELAAWLRETAPKKAPFEMGPEMGRCLLSGELDSSYPHEIIHKAGLAELAYAGDLKSLAG